MRPALIRGLLFGAVGVHLAVVGVLLMLHQRPIVVGTISLGQAVLLLLGIGAGVMAGRGRLLQGLIAGAASAVSAITVETSERPAARRRTRLRLPARSCKIALCRNSSGS